jgi:protein TonB
LEFPVEGFLGFRGQAQDEPKPKKSAGSATSPRVIKTVEPAYTDEARVAHIQGTVTLEVAVHRDGTASVTKVIQGLGYGLDEAAIRALEQFQFEPGTMDGETVESQARMTVNFHLY